jgi:hypothetical protein
MSNGFRQKKQSTNKDKLKEMHVTLQNMQQMFNIQKMITQQFAQNLSKIDRDVNNAMGVINDLQYRTLAMLEVFAEATGKSADDIEEAAEKLKLKDYNEASDKEDAEKGYEVDSVVKGDSVVILTSNCESDPNKSIFRTKFKLDEEALTDELKSKLLGLKVGEKVVATLPDNSEHEIEVVGVRKPPVEQVEDTAQVAE